jgi:hypothetical protein
MSAPNAGDSHAPITPEAPSANEAHLAEVVLSARDGIPLVAEEMLSANGETISAKEALAVEEMRQQLSKTSQSIFEKQKSLKTILDGHEDKLQNRWRKKDKKQRSGLLNEAQGRPLSI